ncbi:hypothetical protein ACFL40_02290 [candidate division KSB1 bacterium]
MKKEVLSIFVDGNELKLVQAKRVKGKIKIISVEHVSLNTSIDEKESVYSDNNFNEDCFGTEEFNESIAPEDKQNDNKSMFYDILNKYPVERSIITLNLPETNAGIISIDNSKEVSNKKLKKRIIDEIQKDYALTVTPEELFLLPSDNGELKAVFQRGSNPILDIIEDIRPFLGKNLTVGLVEVNEIAIVNLINRVYSLKKDEISVVVYIGNEFSRIFFMKGKKIAGLVPVINEGYTSVNILSRLYGKISLESDESNFAEFDRIILAGEAQLIQSKEFFIDKFPNSEVSYIGWEGLDVSELEQNDIDYLSVYAIPLSSAWKIIEPKYDGLFNDNFLPKAVKNRQKSLKIAWHGIVFLIALCTMFIYFLGQYLIMERKISKAEYTSALLDKQIDSANEILAELDNIQSRIIHYEQKFARYDSLTKDCKVNSRFLESLTQNVKNTNSIWLNSISLRNDDFSMGGESIFRSRVSKFVSSYNKYKLNNVSRFKVRNREIFKFELHGKIEIPPY